MSDDAERTVVIDSAALRELGGFLPVPRALAARADLTAAAKLAYGQMIAYGWEKDFAFPAQERLAEDLAMCERNVRNVLTELRDAGLLDWVRRGQGRPNHYIVKLPANFAGQDRHSGSGQERNDRHSASGLERQASSGHSLEKKKGIDKENSAPLDSPPAESAGAGKSRPSWMTPYGEAWSQRFDGDMPYPEFSKPLSRLEKRFGAEETLKRWRIYLEGAGTWASASHFSRTIGEWANRSSKGRQPQPPERAPRGSRFANDEATEDAQARQRGLR